MRCSMAAAPSAQAGLALVLAAALLAATLPGSQARWNLLYFSLSDNSLECDQLQVRPEGLGDRHRQMRLQRAPDTTTGGGQGAARKCYTKD